MFSSNALLQTAPSDGAGRLRHGSLRAATSALVLVFTLLLAACSSDMYVGLNEEDANEILSALYAADIQASKQPSGEGKFSIQVEASQLQEALSLTQDKGLPRKQFADLGTLFKKEGLVSTPAEERVRFLYGVSQELSNTLRQIDGVVSARVHPVIPANDPMADKVRPSSASVFIKHDPKVNLQSLAPAIRNLVMRSIEGLSADDITLTFIAAEPPVRKPRLEAAVPLWAMVLFGVLGGAFALSAAAAVWLALRHRALVSSGLPHSGDASSANASWWTVMTHKVPPNASARASNDLRFQNEATALRRPVKS